MTARPRNLILFNLGTSGMCLHWCWRASKNLSLETWAGFMDKSRDRHQTNSTPRMFPSLLLSTNLCGVCFYLSSIYLSIICHLSINHLYRHTSEIFWVQFQTTAIKWMLQRSKSHNFFGFPVHIKVMFTLYCGLLNMQ